MHIGFSLEICDFFQMTELKEFFNELSIISKTQVYRILNFDFSNLHPSKGTETGLPGFLLPYTGMSSE